MKKFLILSVLTLLCLSCNKEVSSEPSSIASGEWRLVSYTNNTGTYTNANACWADDRLVIKNQTAIIIQGKCKVFRDKPDSITFTWKLLPDNKADFGGDLVNISLTENFLKIRRTEAEGGLLQIDYIK